ncbi:hypothetical protein SNEBB_009643 [Seison nebaliae]|nr:hypothetical protein SNEBB_009643 [Seison nebaliae]
MQSITKNDDVEFNQSSNLHEDVKLELVENKEQSQLNSDYNVDSAHHELNRKSFVSNGQIIITSGAHLYLNDISETVNESNPVELKDVSNVEEIVTRKENIEKHERNRQIKYRKKIEFSSNSFPPNRGNWDMLKLNKLNEISEAIINLQKKLKETDNLNIFAPNSKAARFVAQHSPKLRERSIKLLEVEKIKEPNLPQEFDPYLMLRRYLNLNHDNLTRAFGKRARDASSEPIHSSKLIKNDHHFKMEKRATMKYESDVELEDADKQFELIHFQAFGPESKR